MKNILLIAAAFTFLVSCKQEKKAIEQFNWLSGKWVGTAEDGNVFYEVWQPLEGNIMKGEGGEMSGKDTIFSEKIQIEQRGEELFYVPTVAQNDGAVDFKFTGMKNDSIVFENPKHDFPQRIVYVKQAGDKLYACIDGLIKGEYSRIEFRYSKEK